MNLDDDLAEGELDHLAHRGTSEQMILVARHPNASLRTLLYLANSGLAEEVDQNPMLPLYVEGGYENVVQILVKIAEQTKRPERLEELASSKSIDVRFQVAINRSTPQRILIQFSEDRDDWLLRSGVASNNSTPTSTLAILAKDDGPFVRRNVSLNECVTTEILSLLADDDDFLVLYRVAGHIKTPSEKLVSLSHHKFYEVSLRAKDTLKRFIRPHDEPR